MIEILITLVVIGGAIWLAKVTLTKILTRPNQSQHQASINSSATSKNNAFNCNTFAAPDLLKAIYELDPKVYVFSDLETTGLYAEQHEITEVAAIKYAGGDNIECFSTLVKPSTLIPRKITNITGISNEMVSKAPKMKTVLPAFQDFVSDADLIFYNAPFDKSFLNKAALDFNSSIHNKFIDALPLAREALPRLHNHKLTTIAKQLNVSISGAHRALDDTTTLMFVYLGCRAILIEQDKLMNVTTLGQRLGGYSAVTTNKALIEQGFQTKAKNEEDKWIYTATDKGKLHIQFSDDESYFLWSESLIEHLSMQNYKPIKKKA